jgi:hypothetical protein
MNLSLRHGFSVCALLTLPAILSGCGDNLDCSADETRNLVHQIAGNEFKRQIGFSPDQELPGLRFSMADIITKEKVKGKVMCGAKLHMVYPLDRKDGTIYERDFNVTYNVEKTDDGRLYVTVFGL